MGKQIDDREINVLIHGNFPYFPRPTIIPPDKDYMQSLMTPESSLKSIAYERDVIHSITRGTADLATGMVLYGGIGQYSGGIGLDYSRVYKEPNFKEEYAIGAIREIAESTGSEINCILAPERSAIKPAEVLAKLLKVPLLVVKKNGYNLQSLRKIFGAYLDSYTHEGKRDLLCLSKDELTRIISNKGKLFALLFDDIIDTGMMTIAVDQIVKQAQNYGIDIVLSEVCALFEKGYTGGRELIKRETGLVPKSGLVIEDIGLFPKQWMKIQSINEGSLSFVRHQ